MGSVAGSELDKITCKKLIPAVSISVVPDVELSYTEFVKDVYDKVYYEVRELLVAHFISEVKESVLARLSRKHSLSVNEEDLVTRVMQSYLSDIKSEPILTRVNVFTSAGSITVGSYYDLLPNRKEEVIENTIRQVNVYYSDF